MVLISGGARGQGAAEARMLVERGASVVIGDVLDDRGGELAEELSRSATFVHHDVTSEADWVRAIETAERMGGLHGLVNNAGVYQPRSMDDTDIAMWERHVSVNQFGCYLGMRMVVAAMERSGGGAIVNISSVAGLRGAQQAFAYCATKWALRGMTRSAARELGGRNIRVNCVCPGVTDTEMLGHWDDAERASRVEAIPMERMGTAEEIARVVLFLLSEDSSYMTGAELAVDGGLAA